MANPNIASISSITGAEAEGALTTANATIVNNAVSSGTLVKVVSLYVSNVDGTNSADVTVTKYPQDDSGGTGRAIASTVAVAADSTVVIIDETSPVLLTEDTSIGALASVNGDLEYVVSYYIMS